MKKTLFSFVLVLSSVAQAAVDPAVLKDLFSPEKIAISQGQSLAGTQIPQAVLDVLAKARAAGAVAYDVADGTGDWNPYTPTTRAQGNMAFSYTEVTPEKLKADMDSKAESNWLSGYETVKDGTDTFQSATYIKKVGGTGHVTGTYDEAWHEDTYARGSSGQKWANNCGFMSDGSLHCLPAARRWSEDQNSILTNADLSRRVHMLYNGHIDIRAGKVVGVEMSGKLSKKAGNGRYTFVDPIALLKAWGFEVESGVKIVWGNTENGVPVVDEATHLIKEAP